eukprot:4774556-Prymnesium_polylepis.2
MVSCSALPKPSFSLAVRLASYASAASFSAALRVSGFTNVGPPQHGCQSAGSFWLRLPHCGAGD